MTIQYVNTGFILSLISDDSKGTTIFLLVLPQNCLKVNKRDAPVQKCKIRPFGCLVYRLYSFCQIFCPAPSLASSSSKSSASARPALSHEVRFQETCGTLGDSNLSALVRHVSNSNIYIYICRRICKRDVHRGNFSWPALDWGAATSILH